MKYAENIAYRTGKLKFERPILFPTKNELEVISLAMMFDPQDYVNSYSFLSIPLFYFQKMLIRETRTEENIASVLQQCDDFT